MKNATLAFNIKQRCNEKGISLNALIQGCELSKSFIYDLEKRNTSPSCDKIQKVADFLDCSVDYLLGRSDAIHNKSNITGNKNVVQQGNVNNSPVTISDILSPPLSEQETELLNIFRLLTPKEKHKVMTLIYEIDDANNKMT